jgi:L-threonylcarbamoyladenylate synthase
MDIGSTEIVQYMVVPGTIGVFAADTVYGVMARALDPSAVTRLYELKRRERKPGTLIAASVDQLVQLGIKRRYLTAVERFWPGAISVVIPCGAELEYLHQGIQSIAVRIPANDAVQSLLLKTGPILTSSANQPGEPTATTIDEAKAYFGDQVDFYVDSGDLSATPPSTVIRMVDDAVEVLRQGAIKIDEQTGEVL